MTTRRAPGRPASWFPAILLAALAAAVYAPALGFGFLSLDDRIYAAANPMVLEGPTASGLRWAWTTFHASNWHPLTWISLMIDARIGGGAASTFHRTNVLLHGLNAALVFLFLRRMTGSVGRSAFAGALFAVHPLHVESVAWIAERKDVLSTAFGLAALVAYGGAEQPKSTRRLALVAALFAASLLAKPMLVTAPLLLLLLDFWPLRRASTTHWTRLAREKWPLFLLSAASCAVTLAAQSHGGALRPAAELPLWARAANAPIAAVTYLADFVRPVRLAVFYPHPGTAVSVAAALACAAALAAATAAAWRARARRPYALTGWLWYVVTLVPVIGIVQAGLQARADRYTYVPLIGISILVAWGLPDLAAVVFRTRSAREPSQKPGAATQERRLEWILAAAAIVVVAWLAVLARRQVLLWDSDVSLYTHALDVTERNDLAHAALGSALALRGDYDGARSHLDEALRLRPDAIEARHERAVLHLREGEPQRAAALWRGVLDDSPAFDDARAGLATALVALGEWEAADRESTRALERSPRLAAALAARGMVRLAQHRPADAEQALRAAIEADLAAAEYRVGLANALASLGRPDDAIAAYRDALRLRPDSFEAHLPLGAMLFQSGRTDEGLAHLAEAVRLAPRSAEARLNLGVALFKLGRVAEARAAFEEVLRVDPANARAGEYLRLTSAGGAPSVSEARHD